MSDPVNLPMLHEVKVARFKLVGFAEIKLATTRNYTVKGLIPRTGIGVIYGPPKSGKSFFVTDLLLHIALGWTYRTRKVLPGSAIYFACEGHSGLPARIEAFRQRFLAEDPDRRVPFYSLAANVDLVADKDALIQAIRAELGNESPVVICIDTLNRSLNGSESKDEDMGKYLRAAGIIAETFGCFVLLVHHSGTDTSRPRGHTSLTGTADVQIKVECDGAGNIVATIEWMKDGPEGHQIVGRLEVVEVGTDKDEDPITSCVVIPVDGVALAPRVAKHPKMTKTAQIALRALRRALLEAREASPTSNHIPSGVTVTTVHCWRDYAYRMGISASDAKPRAQQAAFKRASECLLGTNEVAIWDGYVWMTDRGA